MTKHEIGKPRVYLPGEPPAIFPGEQYGIQAQITPEEMRLHKQTGFEVDITRRATVVVSPMPGWHGAWLRWRWRLFRGAPAALIASVVLSWIGCALAALQLFGATSWGYRPASVFAYAGFGLSMTHLLRERLEARRRRRAPKPWEVR